MKKIIVLTLIINLFFIFTTIFSEENSCLDKECHDDKSNFVHGKLTANNCNSCHNRHDSTVTKNFTLEYYEGNYKSYDTGQYKRWDTFNIKKYKLCFSCHNEKIVLEKFNNKITKFRNGDYNLHFVHLNLKKSRPCDICHQLHDSKYKKNIHNEHSINRNPWWGGRLGFKIKKTGGRCVVGCHKPREYNRKNPIDKKEW